MKLEHMQAFIDKFRYYSFYLDITQRELLWCRAGLRPSTRCNWSKKSSKIQAASSSFPPPTNSDHLCCESKTDTSATTPASISSETSTSQSTWKAGSPSSAPTESEKAHFSSCWWDRSISPQEIPTETEGFPSPCSRSITSINWNCTYRRSNKWWWISRAAHKKPIAVISVLSEWPARWHCVPITYCQAVKNQEWRLLWRCGKTRTFWFWTSRPTTSISTQLMPSLSPSTITRAESSSSPTISISSRPSATKFGTSRTPGSKNSTGTSRTIGETWPRASFDRGALL